MDLLTISSFDGITTDQEPRFPGLFPDASQERARTFKGKKVHAYFSIQMTFNLMSHWETASCSALLSTVVSGSMREDTGSRHAYEMT